MARPKKAPTEKAAKETTTVASEEANVLKSMLHALASAGFVEVLDLKASEPGMSAAIVWGTRSSPL
jgi:type I restriction enzyme M protein